MAQVHPSRAGFIPREDRNSKRERRSRSPERRSRSRERNRNSPSYDAYRAREASGEQAQNDWGRVPPPRASAANGYTGGGGYATQGGGYFEERRKRRDAMTVNVWPPSPKEPARDLSPHGHSRSKHDKKDKHRSKDKDKKRSKHRSRSEDRHRKKHEEDDRKRYDSDRKRKRRRSRSTSPSETETDSSEDRRRRKRRERERDRDRDYERDDRKSRSKSHDARDSRPLEMEEDEDAWVEKPATSMAPPPVPVQTSASNQVATIANEDMYDDDEDSDMEEVGPQLPIRTKEKIDERSYGGALLRGEGSAMAAFLQADPHTRIPRRGEIGLTSDEIESYETVGYVMSGSRHRRMNAVRMRKENQVISAEEKRGILKLQKEERQRREELLKAEFRELVEEKLGGIGAARK